MNKGLSKADYEGSRIFLRLNDFVKAIILEKLIFSQFSNSRTGFILRISVPNETTFDNYTIAVMLKLIPSIIARCVALRSK